MKKNIIKTLSVLFITFSLFSVTAKADEYISSEPRSVYVWNNPHSSINASINQWVYFSPFWRLTTEWNRYDYYKNTWALVNGKWYYWDNNSNMLKNCIVQIGINETTKNYYLKEDGSLLVDEYLINVDNGNTYYANNNGELKLRTN